MFTRKHTRTPEASDLHDVLDVPMFSELPDGSATLYVAMGCFWGAERIFWKIPGVVTTAVGYMGGHATEPTYEDVCGGGTGHTETVMVAYDPSRVSERELLKAFWENHDPTTANRQGNDVGTQYRSAIYWT
ncbi:peptide-methionine (S)-S-oxide reductase MsrA, partial [Agromyces sp. NPDC056379]